MERGEQEPFLEESKRLEESAVVIWEMPLTSTWVCRLFTLSGMPLAAFPHEGTAIGGVSGSSSSVPVSKHLPKF